MEISSSPLPEGTTILAIDYGQKFSGLALFCVGRDPFPLGFGRLAYEDDPCLVRQILDITEQETVDQILVGLPKLLDGQETNMSKIVRAFFDSLNSQTSLTCLLVDETLSTYEAKKRMENSPRYNFKVDLSKVDEVAATIILEDYLSSFPK